MPTDSPRPFIVRTESQPPPTKQPPMNKSTSQAYLDWALGGPEEPETETGTTSAGSHTHPFPDDADL